MIVSIISIIAFPLIIGYIYGRNDIDPDSYNGKIYYASEVD